MELRAMIFIAGNSRSGTTLSGRILGNHPEIFTFSELHFLEEIWMPSENSAFLSEEESVKNFARLISIQREGYLKKRNTDAYLDEARNALKSFSQKEVTFPNLYQFFLEYETVHHQKKKPCEKTPRNVLYIKELLKIYPQCKIICLVRDPKDVLLSQKKKWKRRFLGASASIPLRESIRARINYHPFIISRLWNANALAIAEHSNTERVKIIYFEKLISNPAETVQEICTFLEIPFHDGMLQVEQKGSSLKTDKANTPNIDSTRAGNWKKGLNTTELFICENITKKCRDIFHYNDIHVKPNYFLLAFYYLIFPVQVFIALAANLGRTKNILQSIKKRFA
jgi:omega-hydroxy-beta-dihydromenaquinone-9 sulfotransferase